MTTFLVAYGCRGHNGSPRIWLRQFSRLFRLWRHLNAKAIVDHVLLLEVPWPIVGVALPRKLATAVAQNERGLRSSLLGISEAKAETGDGLGRGDA